MTHDILFNQIKVRCDELRIVAAGTGRASTFSIYKDDVQYRFTIGLKPLLGFEVFTVGAGSPKALNDFLNTRTVLPSDTLCSHFYDKVNCELSGMLAAVYGTATELYEYQERIS